MTGPQREALSEVLGHPIPAVPGSDLLQFFKQSHVGLGYHHLHTKAGAGCWEEMLPCLGFLLACSKKTL